MNTTINVLQLIYSLAEIYDENRQTFLEGGEFIDPLTKEEFIVEVLKQKLGFFLLPDLLECIIGKEVSHFYVSNSVLDSKDIPDKYYGAWFDVPAPKELKMMSSISEFQGKVHFNLEKTELVTNLEFAKKKIEFSSIKEEILFHLCQDKKFEDLINSSFEHPEPNLYQFEIYKGCIASFSEETFLKFCLNPIEHYCIVSFIKKIKDKGIKINASMLTEITRSSLENSYAPWMVEMLMDKIKLPNETPSFLIKETRKVAYEIFRSLLLKKEDNKKLKSIVLGWYEHDTD